MESFKKYIIENSTSDINKKIKKIKLDFLQTIAKTYAKIFIRKFYNIGLELPYKIKEINLLDRDTGIVGFVFVEVIDSNNNKHLCLLEEKNSNVSKYTIKDIKNFLQNDKEVFIQISKIDELKNNDITPELIVKIKVSK